MQVPSSGRYRVDQIESLGGQIAREFVPIFSFLYSLLFDDLLVVRSMPVRGTRRLISGSRTFRPPIFVAHQSELDHGGRETDKIMEMRVRARIFLGSILRVRSC